MYQNTSHSIRHGKTWMVKPMMGMMMMMMMMILSNLVPFVSAVAAAAASATKSTTTTTTRFMLTEEHHHIVPHVMQLVHDGQMALGATVIHVDSHADFGIPRSFKSSMFDMASWPTSKRDKLMEPDTIAYLLEHTQINDFLLAMAYMGVIQHVIFCEPPWSVFFDDVHYATSNISIGVEENEYNDEEKDGKMFVSIDTPVANKDALRTMFAVEEVLSSTQALAKRTGGKYRTIQFTILPYKGAADSLSSLLDEIASNAAAMGEATPDILLDVDLDGYGTTSPGAMATYDAIPSWPDLMRLFHTFHHLCDFGASYWQSLLLDQPTTTHVTADNCTRQWDMTRTSSPPLYATPPLPISAKTKKFRFEVEDMFRDMAGGNGFDEATWTAVEQVLQHHEETIASFRRGGLAFKLYSVFAQPFHVDPTTIDPLVQYWSMVLSKVFHINDSDASSLSSTRAPPVGVTIVRSPFYTPHHHLENVECPVLESFVTLFGTQGGLYHGNHIQVNRSGCLSLDIFPELEIHDVVNLFPYKRHSQQQRREVVLYDMEPWNLDVHSSFFGEHDPYPGDSMVVLDITNDSMETVTLFVNKRALAELPPDGQQKEALWDGDQIEIRAQDDNGSPSWILQQWEIQSSDGPVQSLSTTLGRLPVVNYTPVFMEVANQGHYAPLEVRFVPDNSEEPEEPLGMIAPGRAEGYLAYHGHRLAVYRDGEPVQILDVDATMGDSQVIEIGHEEL